jgi:hypothetical protein
LLASKICSFNAGALWIGQHRFAFTWAHAMYEDTSWKNTTWISGPNLRRRWDMPNSTFYLRLSRGLIPEAEYPFGPTTPYWRLEIIRAFEERFRSKTNDARFSETKSDA